LKKLRDMAKTPLKKLQKKHKRKKKEQAKTALFS